MTEEQIDEVKKQINEELAATARRYIGERLDERTLMFLKAEISHLLRNLSWQGRWPVLEELNPQVKIDNINGLSVLFSARTDRAAKFLKGEAFHGY